MKQKGFTLVELLAVIIVLGLIALIAIPNVTNTLKSNQKKLYQAQLELIEEAARGYLTENIFKFDLSSECVIFLQDLKDGNYIDKNISNPVTKNPFGEGLQVKIIPLDFGTGYDIKVDESTVEATMVYEDLKCGND